jgi:glycosyltransferase involved in cell wall biosynthesis
MDYFPNIDGVCYFVDKILPLIRTKLPNTLFRIVGSNPSSRIQRLAQKTPGVTVTGHVADVRRHLTDVSVSVAPLRIARGTQNKILESMAMGIPVVSTPEAAKGIQAVPDRDFMVADTPDAFARHVVALLKDKELRQRVSMAARIQIDRTHLWSVCMEKLDGIILEAQSKLREVPVSV